jgi:hypothetical protein
MQTNHDGTKTFNGLNGTILVNASSTPGVTVGYVPGGPYGYKVKLRVTVEVRLERLERSDSYETTTHEQVAAPLDFALTTAVWQPPTRTRERDIVMGGATIETLVDVLEHGELAPGFTREKVERLIEMFEKHHLNSLRAGCAHQTMAIDPDGSPLDRTSYALDHTPACPVTGYRWGRSWLLEPLPAGFLRELVGMFTGPEFEGRVYVKPELDLDQQ